MEESMDISVAVSDCPDQEQITSLLNNNVSFENTLATDSPVESSMGNLSFSLSETERLKLRQIQTNGHNRSQRSVLKDLSMNVENQSVANAEQSCLEQSSVVMEEQETSLDDSEERIINIEDTLDEPSPAAARTVEEMTMGDAEEQTNHTHTTSVETVVPQVPYFQRQLVELGRRCWPSTAEKQHYTKGCYWSPDGTCLLLPVHQDGMHVMELPLDLYNVNSLSADRSLTKLQSAVHVPEGGTVYDCVWYPLMNSQDPDTCFWLATRQHEPIHMWDAFDGRLRCSYSGYDEVDEVVAAISLAFSHDGQKIYAGYKRCIKIFDTSRPGRVYHEYPVKFAISCFAQTTEHSQTVTCGNWNGYIQHFDLRSPPNQGPLFTLGGHAAGITQLRYSNDAAGNWQLFSGARKCPKLLQWDMRNYKKPLCEFQREVNTNQRIQFDLSPEQSWLASGGTDGTLNLWNLDKGDPAQSLKVPVHGDCCNGISFNPILPILATSSGQYHFIAGDNHDNTIDTTISTQVEEEENRTIDYENAVLLLWCGDIQSS